MSFLFSRTTFAFLLAALLGSVLLHVSQSVQQAENKLHSIEQQIAAEQERIHVLKAEWAYLNSPVRLKQLAKKHLDLIPPEPVSVFISPEKLPAPFLSNVSPDDMSPNYSLSYPVSYGDGGVE